MPQFLYFGRYAPKACPDFSSRARFIAERIVSSADEGDQTGKHEIGKMASIAASPLARSNLLQWLLLTDPPPAKRALFVESGRSDSLDALALPKNDSLTAAAQSIETAMKRDNRSVVRFASARFLAAASRFYGVSEPAVRVLAAPTLRIREGGWGTELFGEL